MGDGSRASTSSGSRVRMLYFAAPTSFFERDSAAIGLAKVEAAAKKTGLVSDQRLKPVVMMLLTKSQEGGKDADKLHCSC